MEILRLSSKDIKKLKKYELNKNIENTESIIYIYNNKELLKVFKDKDNILNKLYLLNKIFYIKDIIEIEELVFPNNLVKLSGNPAGYTMDFIKDNTNLGMIFYKNEISFKIKYIF